MPIRYTFGTAHPEHGLANQGLTASARLSRVAKPMRSMREFTVPDEVYKEFRKLMELFWNKIAGRRGILKPNALREIIKGMEMYGLKTCVMRLAPLSGSPARKTFCLPLRETTRVRTRRCQLVNRRPRP